MSIQSSSVADMDSYVDSEETASASSSDHGFINDDTSDIAQVCMPYPSISCKYCTYNDKNTRILD